MYCHRFAAEEEDAKESQVQIQTNDEPMINSHIKTDNDKINKQRKRQNLRLKMKQHRKLKRKRDEEKKDLIQKQLIALCKKELIKGHQFQNLYHLPKTRKAVSNHQREYECIDDANYCAIKAGDAVILMESRKMFGIAVKVSRECMTVMIPVSGCDDFIKRNLYWDTVLRMNAESPTYLVSKQNK